MAASPLIVIAFSLWVASSLMPEKAPPEKRIDVVNRVLIEAAELYNKGQVDEAIVLLEQNSKDDTFQVRLDRRLTDYRAKVATPVPTPVPEGLAACRELLAEGRWMAAYQRVKAELKLFPNDPGLEKARLEILEVEPEAAVLQSAVAEGDFRAAIAISRDMLEKRPDDAEVVDFYERTLFNAGMAELRAFNLPQSENYLSELTKRQPDDVEVRTRARICRNLQIAPGRHAARDLCREHRLTMSPPVDEIPDDWDSLTDRDAGLPASPDPAPTDDPEPPALMLMAASWADLVGMLAVCAGGLIAVMVLGQRPALAAFGWAAVLAVLWWACAAAVLVVVRQGTLGMLLAGVRFLEPVVPGRVPRVLAAALFGVAALGLPGLLGARWSPLRAAAAVDIVADIPD